MSRVVGIAVLAALIAPSHGQLSFQLPTDIIGFKSTFQEGDGLPTQNFTLSYMAKQYNRNRAFHLSCDWDLMIGVDASTGNTDTYFDFSSYNFATFSGYSGTTDALMTSWHM